MRAAPGYPGAKATGGSGWLKKKKPKKQKNQ